MAKQKVIEPKNDRQRDYITSVNTKDVTIAIGPAGTSKTAIAAYLAVQWFESASPTEKANKRIILTRPIVEAGRGIGFLKGDMLEKCAPYMTPLVAEMEKWAGKDLYTSMKNQGVIEICPPEFMRGRNFHDSFIIVDEAQNCDIDQLRMIVSRLGRRSKMVINGDPDQVDLPLADSGALAYITKRLEGLDSVGIVKFLPCDIIRNPILASIMERIGTNEDFHNTVCDHRKNGR